MCVFTSFLPFLLPLTVDPHYFHSHSHTRTRAAANHHSSLSKGIAITSPSKNTPTAGLLLNNFDILERMFASNKTTLTVQLLLTLVTSSVQSSREELTECPLRVVRCCSWGESSCRLLARVGFACPGGGKTAILLSPACGRWRSRLTYIEWRWGRCWEEKGEV